MQDVTSIVFVVDEAFPVIGTPTRASDHGSGDAQEPAAVVVDCSMHQAPRSHLFPYAVKM